MSTPNETSSPYAGAVEVALRRLANRIPEFSGRKPVVTSELVADLGDNYDRYHAALATLVEEIGAPIEPNGLEWTQFAELNAVFSDCVVLEAFLRNCRRARQPGGGDELDEPPLQGPDGLRDVRSPLTDAEMRQREIRRDIRSGKLDP